MPLQRAASRLMLLLLRLIPGNSDAHGLSLFASYAIYLFGHIAYRDAEHKETATLC